MCKASSMVAAGPDGFGRLKKPMVQRMAKLADIKHVSGTMTEEMRVGLHRYLKEQGESFVFSNADADAAAAAAPPAFVIPAKTFAFLVRKACNDKNKWLPEELHAFHIIVERWWLDLFQRSKRVADHREHSVVQWKDIEIVMELAKVL
jgi:histone H3/H4